MKKQNLILLPVTMAPGKRFQPRNTRHFSRGAQKGLPTHQQISANGSAVAVDAAGNGVDTTIVVPDVPFMVSLTLAITTAGGYVQGTDIPLIPSPAQTALPANVTAAGFSFATYALFAAYYGLQRFQLGNLKISTTDANNFDKALKFIETRADGTTVSTQQTWNQMAKNPLNPDQTWREIPELSFVSGVQTLASWLDDMVISSTMTFYFSPSANGTASVMNAPKY